MSRLNKILADSPLFKHAVESPDRQQHERDFSTLAFAFLQDRAAGLLPYLLGFEVVDRDEDGAKAVGIFGFNVSGHYYYVPSFFINSQIKGMDLLFSKSTNNFMPLQEEWIDKIINKSNIRLGRPRPADAVQADFESPDMTDMIEPPVGRKFASVGNVPDLEAHFAFNAWNAMQKAAEDALKSDNDFREAFAGAVAALSGRELQKKADAESPIIGFVANKGGPRTMEAFMRSLQNVKYANAFFGFYGSIKPFAVTKYAEEALGKQAKQTIRLSDSAREVEAEIEDESDRDREKARLITDGFAVIDKRSPKERTTVYSDDMSGAMFSPSEPGVYDIWSDDGTFRKMYLLQPFGYPRWRDIKDPMLLIDAESKRSGIVSASSLIASRKYSMPFEAASRSLSSVTAARESTNGKEEYVDSDRCPRYCILDPKTGAGMFCSVEQRVSDGDGHIFKVWNVDGQPCMSVESGGLVTAENLPADTCCGSEPYVRNIRFSNLDIDKPVISANDTLLIPRSFRAIKVESGRGNITVGTMASLDQQLFENGFNKIEVAYDGTDFSVSDDSGTEDRLSKKEACLNLVFKHGMGVRDVDEILSRASTSHKPCSVLAKEAQLVGVNMPMPVPPGPGSDPITGMGIPMEQPFAVAQEGNLTGVPATQDPTAPGFAVGGQAEADLNGQGGGGVLPQEVMDLADQASQAGQKHVFDQSTIAGLAGLYDIGYAIDMYVPELIKSLDRIGRILFIFYWKNDEFAERYGEQDLSQMEDLLRNVFKSFGSLVLKLQEKAVIDAPREVE